MSGVYSLSGNPVCGCIEVCNFPFLLSLRWLTEKMFLCFFRMMEDQMFVEVPPRPAVQPKRLTAAELRPGTPFAQLVIRKYHICP